METKVTPKVDHTPAELDEASRILLGAATRIETRGLWKGFQPRGAGECVITAIIGEAESMGACYYDAAQRFQKYLGLQDWCSSIHQWNDAYVRTKDEVVAKLRAVALCG